jgi:hypothetical protein
MPTIGYRLQAKYMIEEKRELLTAVRKQERRGWEVYRFLEQYRCPSEESEKSLTRLRQLGHLHLLKGAGNTADPEEKKPQPMLPPEVTSGSSMPKRQHQAKQSYRDDDTRAAHAIRPQPGAEIPTIKREFILTPSVDDTLHDVVRLFSRETGSNLTRSHFLRALFKAVAHAMAELESEASEIGALFRPSNAPGNQAAREEYEQRIAEAVLSAFRSCPPFESQLRKPKDPEKRST